MCCTNGIIVELANSLQGTLDYECEENFKENDSSGMGNRLYHESCGGCD